MAAKRTLLVSTLSTDIVRVSPPCLSSLSPPPTLALPSADPKPSFLPSFFFFFFPPIPLSRFAFPSIVKTEIGLQCIASGKMNPPPSSDGEDDEGDADWADSDGGGAASGGKNGKGKGKAAKEKGTLL
jgi:hypothetical protein